MHKLADQLKHLVSLCNYPLTFSGDSPNFLTRWLVRSNVLYQADSMELSSRIMLEHELSFASEEEKENSWRYYVSANMRDILLESMFQTEEDKAIYGLCSVYCTSDQEVFLFTRASLPLKVWVNGCLVNASTFEYHVKPFQVICNLKQGVNTILIEKRISSKFRSLPEDERAFTISIKPVRQLLETDREQVVFTAAKVEQMKQLYYVLPDKAFCVEKQVTCLVLPYYSGEGVPEPLLLEVINGSGSLLLSREVSTYCPADLDLRHVNSGVLELRVRRSSEGSALSNAYIFCGDYEGKRQRLLQELQERGMDSDFLELQQYLTELALGDKGVNHGKVELHYDRIYYHLLREFNYLSIQLEQPERRVSEEGERKIHTRLRKSPIDGAKLAYTVFLPRDYTAGDDSYPLIFCMPFGTMVNTIPEGTDLMYRNQFDDVIIACMYARGGYNKDYINEMDIIGFIDEIIRDWRVDRDRVYLMGVCSGALRIFGLATRFPGTFAAMANIAGTFRADINQPDYSMLQNLGVMPVYQLLNIEDDVLNTTRVLDSANHMPNVTNWCFPFYSHKESVELFQSPELFKRLLQHKRDKNPREILFHMKEPIYNSSSWLTVEQVQDLCRQTFVHVCVSDSSEIRIHTDQGKTLSLLLDRHGLDLKERILLTVNSCSEQISIPPYSQVRIRLEPLQMVVSVLEVSKNTYESYRNRLSPAVEAMGIKALYRDSCLIISPSAYPPEKRRYYRTLTQTLQQPLRERARNYKYQSVLSSEADQEQLAASNFVYLHPVSEEEPVPPNVIGSFGN